MEDPTLRVFLPGVINTRLSSYVYICTQFNYRTEYSFPRVSL